MKTGYVLTYLRDYLGDELYDSCMMNYYRKWEFKHPQPKDIKNEFEENTGKDLAWFFDDVIKTNKMVDFKVKLLKVTDDNKQRVRIVNKRKLKIPVKVYGYVNDSLKETIWLEPNQEYGTFSNSKINKATINNNFEMLDINASNDRIDKTKMFPKIERVIFKMSPKANYNGDNRVTYTPIIGGNVYDKTMLGVMFSNFSLPRNSFEYTVAPMYSFGRKSIAGFADVHKIYLGDKNIKKMVYGVSVKSFKDNLNGLGGEYLSVKPYVNMDISKLLMRKNIKHNIDVFGGYINHNNEINSHENYLGFSASYNFVYQKNRHELAFKYKVDYISETGLKADNSNTSAVTLYKFRYFKKNYVELRVFAGKTLKYNTFYGSRTKFSLGGQNGTQDYFYEQYMFGRNEFSGFFAQQRIANHGGFKTVSSFGTTNGWMFTTNTYVKIPRLNIIGVYGDYGMFTRSKNIVSAYDLGVGVRFFNDNFSVYFPVLESSNLKNASIGLKYHEKIRFNLNLNILAFPKILDIVL
jgi:hypothetical protein